MMRQRFILSMIIAMCCWTTQVWGHAGARVYPIYEIPTADLPDLHDGTLEE